MPKETKNDELLRAEVWYASALQWLRKRKNTKGTKNTLTFFGVIYIIPALIATIIDLIFTKDNSFGTALQYVFVYVRAALLIVMVISGWCMIYVATDAYVMKRKESDPGYVTLRERSSLRTRRYTVAIGVAVILALCLVTVSSTTTFTILLSILLAGAVSLFAYVRTTERERRLRALGLPDPRDKVYDENMARIQKENAERARLREEKKQEKQKKRNRYLRDQ